MENDKFKNVIDDGVFEVESVFVNTRTEQHYFDEMLTFYRDV